MVIMDIFYRDLHHFIYGCLPMQCYDKALKIYFYFRFSREILLRTSHTLKRWASFTLVIFPARLLQKIRGLQHLHRRFGK